jgi:transposase
VSRVLRPNYKQQWLLPPSLEEWVPPEHPVRFVRDFVDALDLGRLGFREPAGLDGRPAYAADLLLKIWLFGFMERIRSTRGLEKACLQVMPFLWLTGRLHPDHNTLWRFFNTNRAALTKLFKVLMASARDAGLVGFVLHALDGTKLQAASSTDTALHRKALDEKLERLDEVIAEYTKAVETEAPSEGKGEGYAMPASMQDADARKKRIRQSLARRIEDREDERVGRPAEQLAPSPAPQQELPMHAGGRASLPDPTAVVPEEPAPKEETKSPDDEPPAGCGASGAGAPPAKAVADPMLREAHVLKQELLAKKALLTEAGTAHLHTREPEARMMKGRAMSGLGYNAQIVVDHDSDLIVVCDVVAEENDLGQLDPMLAKVQEQYDRTAEQTVADNGYNSSAQLAAAETRGASVLVAQREEPESKGAFSKAFFRYDAADDVYVCPLGERLIRIGTSKARASQKHPDTIYRCGNKSCPSRAECSKDSQGRKIRRPEFEEALVRQVRKQQDPRMGTLLSLRKEVVEHLFGIVKGIDGFRRFTVRGLEKARAQWSLVCLGVNLRKLAAMAYWEAGKLVPLAPPATALA